MKRLEKKHPLAIRWFHWINFPVLSIMIWSGLLIYWANDVYNIRIGNRILFHFFPDRFYNGWQFKIGKKEFDPVHIAYHLPQGMALHFFFMWVFAVNGLLYVLYTAFSGEWRYLLPNRDSMREAIQVVLFDLHLSKKHPPRRKFNGAQQFAYTGVVAMGLGSLVTGLGIYKAVQFAWISELCGGYMNARFIHFWLTIGYVMFFLVHVVQVMRAGWNNFRSMVTGYEVVVEPDEEAHRNATVGNEVTA